MRLILAMSLVVVACSTKPNDADNASSVLVDLGGSNQAAIDAYNNLDTSKCEGAQAIVSSFGAFDGDQKNATEAGANQLIADGDKEAATATDASLGTTTDRAIDAVPDTAVAAVTPPAAPVDPATTVAAATPPADPPITVAAATPPADPPTTVAAATATDTATATGIALVDGDTDYSMALTTVNGIKTCVVTMPVNPISPALVQKIAQQTGATHIYNLGQRSGALVESGATNTIDPTSAYYQRDGSASTITNSSSRVVESDDAGAKVNFTWDTQAVASATGYNAASGPRPENDYICNATGYTIAASVGKEVEYLPGLKLQPLDANVKQGFLHVDSGASGADVAKAVQSMIGQDFPRGGAATAP